MANMTFPPVVVRYSVLRAKNRTEVSVIIAALENKK